MSKLEFVGASGEVSGFDAKSEASVLLVLETLLAAYAKSSTRSTTGVRAATYYRLLAEKVVSGDQEFGRCYFLSPVGYKCAARMISFDKANQTSVLNKPYTMITSSPKMAVVHPVDPEDEELRNSKGNILKTIVDDCNKKGCVLNYVDIDHTQNWANRDFFALVVQLSKGNDKKIAFLPILKDIQENRQMQVEFYIRNVVAGNITATGGMKKYRFDHESLKIVESNEEIEYIKPDESKVLSGEKGLPSEGFWNEMVVLPSVAIKKESYTVIDDQNTEYKRLLVRYLRAFSRNIGLGLSDNGVEIKIGNLNDPTNGTVYLSDSVGDLIKFARFLANNGKNTATIVVRHKNIGRLIFGSHGEWHLSRFDKDTLSSMTISTYGFGCVDKTICTSLFVDDSSDISSKTWEQIVDVNSRYKNQGINELLGLTTDELNSRIFTDNMFLQSYCVTTRSYVGALENWLKTTVPDKKRTGVLEDAIDAIKRVYSETLGQYLSKVFKKLSTTVSNEGNRSNYIKIMQDVYPFSNGYRFGDSNPTENTTKLVYSIGGHSRLRISDGSCRRIEGGSFLKIDSSKIMPTEALNAIPHNAASVNLLILSAKSPYGYVAADIHRDMKMSDTNIDFFINTRAKFMQGNIISLVQSTQHTLPKIKLEMQAARQGILSADNGLYYSATTSDNNSEEVFMEKRVALLDIKKIWREYIFTQEFVTSMFPLKDANEGTPQWSRNVERIFALRLAKKLREIKGGNAISIYNLMLYVEKDQVDTGYTKSSVLLNEINSYGQGNWTGFSRSKRLNFGDLERYIKDRFPRLHENFLRNCDAAYLNSRTDVVIDVLSTMLSDNQTNFKEYTNCDYINAFLLSEDFSVVQGDSKLGYLNRDQYIAISASVIYEKMGVNEKAFFFKNNGYPQYKELTNSSFVINKMIKVAGKTKSLTDAYNSLSSAILANIADVPVYNCELNQRSGAYNVFIGTLSTMLSVNLDNLYMLVRERRYRVDNRNYHIDILTGRPVPEDNRRSVVVRGEGSEFDIINSETARLRREEEQKRANDIASGLISGVVRRLEEDRPDHIISMIKKFVDRTRAQRRQMGNDQPPRDTISNEFIRLSSIDRHDLKVLPLNKEQRNQNMRTRPIRLDRAMELWEKELPFDIPIGGGRTARTNDSAKRRLEEDLKKMNL